MQLYNLILVFSSLIGLIGVSAAAADGATSEPNSEYQQLYDKLFVEHYEFLGVENTFSLLKQIEPLVLEVNDSKTKQLVKDLIKANNINQENCFNEKKFFETFSILYKKQFDGQKVFGPTININDYLDKLRLQQVQKCSSLFMLQANKINQDDVNLMTEIVSNLQQKPTTIDNGNSLEKVAHRAIIKTISNHIKQGDIMSRFGDGRKKKLAEELEKVSQTCDRIDNLFNNYDQTLRVIFQNDLANTSTTTNDNERKQLYREYLLANKKLIDFIDIDRICSLYVKGEVNGLTRTKPLKEILTKVIMREFE